MIPKFGPHVLSAVENEVNNFVGGYFVALPSLYNYNLIEYPLLVFLHGTGQFGNGKSDLSLLLNEAIPELLDQKLFPPSFIVDGKRYSFIVLIPQFNKAPSVEAIANFVQHGVKNYRVDSSRIYLSGFSKGGILTCDFASEYPSVCSAIVPISGVSSGGNLENKCKKLADSGLPIWIFHNDKDEFIDISYPKRFVEILNSFNPTIIPKLTIFPAWGLYGHDAWTKATDPNYRENGKNIYEWMLQFKK